MSKKILGYFLIGVGFIIPNISFAAEVNTSCSTNGYTISNINGIFTDEEGARKNERFLKISFENKYGDTYKGQKVDYQYLLNPSHLAGIGDLIKSIEQKLFDSWAVVDYDLVEMIKDSSDKVKTQKLLVVGYSQGNFYSNSFYDSLADKPGGVPKESIGAYSVATPAGRVAGNGKYITSDTDKVIAGWVSSFTLGNIMKPNTHIVFKEDANGHSFSDTYMKYRGAEIISDIRSSLDNLSANNIQDEQGACIDKPDLGLVGNTEQYVKGAAFAVFDPIANGTVKVAVGAGGIIATGARITYDATIATANLIGRGAKIVYDTTLTVGRSFLETLSSVVTTVGDIFAKKSVPVAPNGFLGQISNAFSPNETVSADVEQSINTPNGHQPISVPTGTQPTASAPSAISAPSISKLIGGRSGGSRTTANPLPVSPVEPPLVPPVTVPDPVPPVPAPVSPVELPPVPLAPTPEPLPVSPPAPPAIPEVADFSIIYDKDKLELVFSWTPFAEVAHKIFDASGAPIFETTTDATYRQRIYEIGRDYSYSIKAFDVDGLELASVTKFISIPSFTRDTRFYSADYKYLNNAQEIGPVIEFSYDSYPFAPQDLVYTPNGGPSTDPNYKAAVFYLNKDAPSDPIANKYLFNSDPLDSDRDSVLRVKYIICGGDGSQSFHLSLILADVAGNCHAGSTVQHDSINYPIYLGDSDNHLLLPAQGPNGESTFSSNDYFTVVYYGFYREYPPGTSDEISGNRTFELLAADKTHYRFDENTIAHQKPNPPTNMQFVLDEASSILTIYWDAASDPDSIDGYLRYEISYDLGQTWQEVGLADSLMVAAGNTYLAQVRAIDDFGQKSEVLQDSFSVPDMPHPKFGISNLRWGNIGGEPSVSFDYPEYPFIKNDNNSFNAMIFYLNQLPPISYGLTVYPHSSYSQVQFAYPSCSNPTPSDHEKLILYRYPLSPCQTYSWEFLNASLFPTPEVTGGNITLPIRALSNANKSISELSSADYLTVGFYSVDNYGNVIPIANDTHRYYYDE